MKAESRRRAKRSLANKRTNDWKVARFCADNPLPGLRIDPTGGDPDLVREMTALAKTYDVSLESCRQGFPTMAYSLLRRLGLERFSEWTQKWMSDKWSSREACGMSRYAVEWICRTPGDWLFERLPDRYKHGHLLRYHFTVSFEETDFVVRFRNLESATTPKGRIYLPPGGHRVAMAGRTWKVAFHRHAMERLSMRLQTTTEPSFREYTDRWKELSGGQWHYEPLELPNGQQGMRLLKIIDSGWERPVWYTLFLRAIFEEERAIPRNAKLAIVLGYMPVWVSGQYASAITFLCPGYDTTPEKALIDALPWGHPDRHSLLALTRNAKYHQMFDGDSIEAIHWFHQNGVPQVWVHEP